MTDTIRPGEIALPFDPAEMADDAKLVFIGRIRSPWKDRESCPRNLRQARERGGGPARVEVAAAYRDGLQDLETCSHIILLYWMDRARRDIVLQTPRGAAGTRGVFAVRSPVRPNPIALATVKLLSCDRANGVIEVDAIDCLDGTPLLDIKPYLPTVDVIAEAAMPERLP